MIKKSYKNFFEKFDPNNLNPSNLLKGLLTYRANEKDNELINQLLKHLVFKYALTEKKLRELNQELTNKQERLDEDLKAAAEIQQSLLPKDLPKLENLNFAWKFIPSDFIGGDIFNIIKLDESHICIYAIDVSGHGVPAAMVTVSLYQLFNNWKNDWIKNQKEMGDKDKTLSPKNILNMLDHEYPIERFDKFFTIIFIVLNIKDGNLIYSNAAHPSPVLLSQHGSMKILDKGGTIIGLGGIMPYEEETIKLVSGDKLILYTDGVTEYQNKKGIFYGQDRLYDVLECFKGESIHIVLEEVLKSMMVFGENISIQDDVSLIGVEFNLSTEKKYAF
ncbi:MAG: SpoIIE family protein phosphatase [Desulfobacterales bacterium]|nr:SpoIIE family protein phosphatase [Desulfobacterales bacterium]